MEFLNLVSRVRILPRRPHESVAARSGRVLSVGHEDGRKGEL